MDGWKRERKETNKTYDVMSQIQFPQHATRRFKQNFSSQNTMDSRLLRCVFKTCQCNKYKLVLNGVPDRMCECSHDKDCHDLLTEEEREMLREDSDSDTTKCRTHECDCNNFVKDLSPFVKGCQCKHSQSEHRPLTRDDKRQLTKLEKSKGKSCVQQCDCSGFAAKPGSKFQTTTCADCPHPLLDHRSLSNTEITFKRRLERARSLCCQKAVEEDDQGEAGREARADPEEAEYEDVVVKGAQPAQCGCTGFTGVHWAKLWSQMQMEIGSMTEVVEKLTDIECECGHAFVEHCKSNEDDSDGEVGVEKTSTALMSKFVVVRNVVIDASVETTLAMKPARDEKDKDIIIFTVVSDRSILFWCADAGNDEATTYLSENESDKENAGGRQRRSRVTRSAARLQAVPASTGRLKIDLEGRNTGFRYGKEIDLPGSLLLDDRTPILTKWHPRRNQLLIASTTEFEASEVDEDDGVRRTVLPVAVYDHGARKVVPGGVWAGEENRTGSNVCSITWHPAIPVFALGLSNGCVSLYTSQLFDADDVPYTLRSEFEELDNWSGMWTRRAPLVCADCRALGNGKRRELTCVEFSKNGTLLATGYIDGVVIVSSIRDHKRGKHIMRADEVQVMHVWEGRIEFGGVKSLCWDTKSRFLAVGGEDDAITLFYNPTPPSPSAERSPLATTGNRAVASVKMAKRKAPEDEVKKRGKKNKSTAGVTKQKDALLKFFNPVPTSSITSTGISSSTVTAIALFTHKAVLRQHASFVSSVYAHPRGVWLLSAGYDGVVCVWDVEAVMRGNGGAGRDGGDAKEKRKEGTEMGEVKIIKAVRKIKLTSDPIESLSLSPNGSHLFAKIYYKHRGSRPRPPPQHEVVVCSMPADVGGDVDAIF